MNRRNLLGARAPLRRVNDILPHAGRTGDPAEPEAIAGEGTGSPITAQAPRHAPPSMAEINAAMLRWR